MISEIGWFKLVLRLFYFKIDKCPENSEVNVSPKMRGYVGERFQQLVRHVMKRYAYYVQLQGSSNKTQTIFMDRQK